MFCNQYKFIYIAFYCKEAQKPWCWLQTHENISGFTIIRNYILVVKHILTHHNWIKQYGWKLGYKPWIFLAKIHPISEFMLAASSKIISHMVSVIMWLFVERYGKTLNIIHSAGRSVTAERHQDIHRELFHSISSRQEALRKLSKRVLLYKYIYDYVI